MLPPRRPGGWWVVGVVKKGIELQSGKETKIN